MNVKDAFKRSVPKSVSASWEHTSSRVSHGLTAFVKTLRNAPDESQFISDTMLQMKKDFRGHDLILKSQHVAKLTFLYMLGHDISWASFHIVEVMSAGEFDFQRVGFFAAALCFRPDTDVLLLTTNLFKLHFTGGSSGMKTAKKSRKKALDRIGTLYNTSVAMNCLASIVSEELAQNLLHDIFAQLNSTKSNLRKRAVLLLFPVFRRWPKALRLSFDRLKKRLKDENQAVRVAAVNVICELAKINPRNYLNVIPQLYELLQTTSSNWMLIKIVKLMSNILPIEPRLMKKLREPLVNIISGSSARSLVYECTNCITSHGVMAKEIVHLCVEKLQLFIEDPDPNFKYLGMCGLCKIQPQAPGRLEGMKDLIVERLSEEDVSIKSRALDILSNMVTQNNMIEIVMKLQEHLLEQDDSAYMNRILTKIITVCSQEEYGLIDDFIWYIGTLKEFAYLSMSKKNAELIAFHLMDVIYRVENVREFGVQQMEELLIENQLLGDNVDLGTTNLVPILYAIAFILGEYGEFITDGNFHHILQLLLQARIKSLPSEVQAVFIHSALKIMGYALMRLDWDSSIEVLELSINQVEQFTTSKLAEVQERSAQYLLLIKGIYDEVEYEDELTELGEELVGMYTEKLAPVDDQAQTLIKPPKGLNLNKMIGESLPDDVGCMMISDQSGFEIPEHDADMDGEEWLNEDAIPKVKKKPVVAKTKSKPRTQKIDFDKSSPFYIGDVMFQNSYSGEEPENDENEDDDRLIVDNPKARMKQRFLELQKKARYKNKKGKPTFKVTKGTMMVKGSKRKKMAVDSKPGKAKWVDPLAMVDLRNKQSSDEDSVPQTKTYAQINEEKKQAEMGLVKDFKKSVKKAKRKKAKKQEAKEEAVAEKIKQEAILRAKKEQAGSPRKPKKKAKGKKKKELSKKSGQKSGADNKSPDLLDFTTTGVIAVPDKKPEDFLSLLGDFAPKKASPKRGGPLDIFDNLITEVKSSPKSSHPSKPPEEPTEEISEPKEVQNQQIPKKAKTSKPKRKSKRKPKPEAKPKKKPAGKKRPKGKKRVPKRIKDQSKSVAAVGMLDDVIENDNISEVLAAQKIMKRESENKTPEDEKSMDLLSINISAEAPPIDQNFDLMGFIDSSTPNRTSPTTEEISASQKPKPGGIFGMICNPTDNVLESEAKTEGPALTSPPEILLSTNALTISYAVDYSPAKALILNLICECRPGGKTVKNVSLFLPASGPIHFSNGEKIVLAKTLKSNSPPRAVRIPFDVNKLNPATLACKVSYKCGKLHNVSTLLEVSPPMLLKQSNPPSPAMIGKLINTDKKVSSIDLPGVSSSLISEVADVLLLHGCLKPVEPVRKKKGPWRFYSRTLTRKPVLVVLESSQDNSIRLTAYGSNIRTKLAHWLADRLLSEFVEEEEEDEDDYDE